MLSLPNNKLFRILHGGASNVSSAKQGILKWHTYELAVAAVFVAFFDLIYSSNGLMPCIYLYK